MPTPRRSVLTGQPLTPATPEPPAKPARSEPASRGPLWMLALAVLVLLSTLGLLAVWRARPGALPFVPFSATPTALITPTVTLTPHLIIERTSLPEDLMVTPTLAPIPNPGGSDVSQELESIEMMAGGYGWGQGRHSLWRTNDGGQTWFDVTPPLPASPPVLEHVFFRTRLSAWFLLPPAAIYITHDGGQNWRSAPAPFGAAELYFADDAHGWAWSEAQHSLYQSVDGGQSWARLATAGLPPLPSTPLHVSLTFADTLHGWLALPGQDPVLYASADGGQSWSPRDLPLPPGLDWAVWSPLAAPHFFDDNYAPGVLPAWAVERSSRREVQLFFITGDGGLTWQPGQPVSAGVSYSSPGADRLYVVDVRGVLQRSLDGGRSWQPGGSFRDRFGSGLQLTPQGIDFVNNELGWAWQVQGERFILFQTVDGGDTWRRLDYTSQAGLADALAVARQGSPLVSVAGDQPDAGEAPSAGRRGPSPVGERPALTESPTGRAAVSPTGRAAACRWQAADDPLPLLPIRDGPFEGWNLYLNPAHGFSFKIPPDWALAEITYACPGQSRDVHRLVLAPSASQPGALFTLAFRRPDQSIPLRDPAAQPPAERVAQGTAAFFSSQPPRAVLAGLDVSGVEAANSPRAIYYNHGAEIEVGSQLIFTAVLESNQPGHPLAALSPNTVQQVEQMLASFEPLRADAGLLSSMDVQSSFSTSPDGAWEAEVLVAQSMPRGPIGYDYQRVTVSSKDGRQRWTALDTWVRHTNGAPDSTGFVWSWDGRWLYLYNSSLDDICPLFEYHYGLRRLDLTSGQVEVINLYPENAIANFGISPDGEQIALLPDDYLTHPRILLRSLHRDLPIAYLPITELPVRELPVTEITFEAPRLDSWGAGSIRWSPDGRRLVFAIAGPLCAQRDEKRLIMLVNPAAGQARVLTTSHSWLTIDRWLPDGRLRLADHGSLFANDGNLFALDVDSGQLTQLPPDPPDQLALAENTLRGYFTMLHNTWYDFGTYDWAADHYGGSYKDLLRLNPDVNPQDKAALLQRACEQNGYYCLRVRRVTARQSIPWDGNITLFRFTVEFLKADGSLFDLRGRTAFDFTVSLRPDTVYRVLELPPK